MVIQMSQVSIQKCGVKESYYRCSVTVSKSQRVGTHVFKFECGSSALPPAPLVPPAPSRFPEVLQGFLRFFEVPGGYLRFPEVPIRAILIKFPKVSQGSN